MILANYLIITLKYYFSFVFEKNIQKQNVKKEIFCKTTVLKA